MNPKLTPERLLRKAVVYIRQSKPSQLIHNQESTRLQFSLAERARSLGFTRIVVVDDDLGAAVRVGLTVRGSNAWLRKYVAAKSVLYFAWRGRDWRATAVSGIISSTY